MCLINFHFQDHPTYKLIVAANRDEKYDRPTAPASFWEDCPFLLAGRDLLQMGTWFGVTTTGRFAALTNYRDPSLPDNSRFSRGEIVRNYLTATNEPLDFVHKLSESRHEFAGFNLIVGNGDALVHYNNILNVINVISPGTYSLSNHSLDTPWPKSIKGKKYLNELVQAHPNQIALHSLFEILSDQTIAKDEELPQTGVSLEMERLLSPLFIKMSGYGTRSSTVLLIDKQNNVTFAERTFHNGAYKKENQFTFSLRS